MSDKKPVPGLGRGLAALLDDSLRRGSTDGAAGEPLRDLRAIEVARIRPNPAQPRMHFDENAIAELADSIVERGVLQPILVRPAGDSFELIAGERRWRAAQRAQLHTIPAIIREIDDSAAAEIALIENVQRQDLNAIEEAEGYKQLIERFGHSQEDIGQLVNKSRSHVANLLRLLNLPAAVKESLARGDISMGHARAIATADDPEELLRRIVGGGLTVRQAEALASESKAGTSGQAARTQAEKPQRTVDPDLAALERQLGDMLGVKVKVAHKGPSGTVSLQYSDLDQLDMICQRLSGEQI